jgi:glucose 1-dehydrogenase
MRFPDSGPADYDCTKSAIPALTRTLALELAPDKINVNSIGPGMVLTPFKQQAIDDPKFRDEQVQSIPLKRAAQPEEIGWLAVYLTSSQADYVTGATYYIDGGLCRTWGKAPRLPPFGSIVIREPRWPSGMEYYGFHREG